MPRCGWRFITGTVCVFGSLFFACSLELKIIPPPHKEMQKTIIAIFVGLHAD